VGLGLGVRVRRWDWAKWDWAKWGRTPRAKYVGRTYT